MSYDDLKQRLRDGEYVDGYEAASAIENLEHRLANAQAAGVELWREIAEFAERSHLEYADTEEWTRRDSGSCLTIRVPVALLNRIREATTPPQPDQSASEAQCQGHLTECPTCKNVASKCVGFTAPAGFTGAAAPSAAQAAGADKLFSAIINLPCIAPGGYSEHESLIYRFGHRDARHAAAELVAASVGAQVAGKLVASDDLRNRIAPRPLAYTLDDYWQAPSGIGPLAAMYAGTAHRLIYDLIAALLYTAPVPAPQQKPVARLHEYVSDRPFSEGKKFFEITILDRSRCTDGMELFGAPVPAPATQADRQPQPAVQAAVNQQMAAALRFMLAYENDDAVAIAEIQAAFSQQEAVKDAQEFARCYCARKMRDALNLAAPAAVPQGVEAQAPAQPSAAPVLEADLLALREDVAKLYQSAMAITSQAAQEFAQRVVEHVRRTHGVAPAQPSAEQVRDAALEEAATICDSADKSTHPADLADRIRAKRTTASSEQSAGGFGGGARNSDGSFVISTGGGGARNSDGSFVISAAGGGVDRG